MAYNLYVGYEDTKLDELRMLLRARMIERRDSYSSAGRAMNVSHAMIQLFLGGDRGLSVETCMKLAKYLGKPLKEVLRMAGHDGVAELLEEDTPYEVDRNPHSAALEQLLKGLDEDQQTTIINAVIGIANGLRKQKKRGANG